jgi:hypothetical protein
MARRLVPVRGLLAVLSVLGPALAGSLLVPEAARAGAAEDLRRAHDYFLVADFGTAREQVRGLLASGALQGEALREAHVLVARCEIGLGSKSSAVDAFCAALRVDPLWRPDRDLYTTDEVTVFETAERDCLKQAAAVPPGAPSPLPQPILSGTPWYRKPVTLGLVGAGAVAAVVLALSGGEDGGGGGGPELPEFPVAPGN